MKRDNRKVDWEFRVKMTEDLYFMVEKRIDTMLEKYGDDVKFTHEFLNKPPRIQITAWCTTDTQLYEFIGSLESLTMFDLRVYPFWSVSDTRYLHNRMFVLKYKFDEYSYQKEK